MSEKLFPEPENLEMYTVPGNKPPTPDDAERYLRSKARYVNDIQDNTNPRQETRHTVASSLDLSSRADFIQMELTSGDPIRCQEAIKLIPLADRSRTLNLIELALNSEDPTTKISAAELICYLPNEERAPVRASIQEQISQMQRTGDDDAGMCAAKLIRFAPDHVQSELIRHALTSRNPQVVDTAIRQITFASATDRPELLELAFNLDNYEAQLVAASLSHYAPLLNQKIIDRLHQYLEADESIKQITGARMIASVPIEYRAEFISKVLNSENIEAQKIAAGMIEGAQINDRSSLILQTLNKAEQVQVIGVKCIKSAHPTERAKLIARTIETGHQKAKSVAATIIPEIHDSIERERIVELFITAGLGNELIQSRLYDNTEVESDHFTRTNFKKSGSTTTLLGGKLKQKIILRTISPQAFTAWQALFENTKYWTDAGFDYVPIEPIQSFRLNQNNLVDVYSGVLDLSLYDWQRRTKRFSDELEQMKGKIEDALKAQNIAHMHAHYGNYCLRFYRDASGNPDFSKTPRLYLIDFDEAIHHGLTPGDGDQVSTPVPTQP